MSQKQNFTLFFGSETCVCHSMQDLRSANLEKLNDSLAFVCNIHGNQMLKTN